VIDREQLLLQDEKELVEQMNEALANPAVEVFNEKGWSPCKSANLSKEQAYCSQSLAQLNG
jgi:hypothetical protein